MSPLSWSRFLHYSETIAKKAASLRTFILSVIPARLKTFLPMILHSWTSTWAIPAALTSHEAFAGKNPGIVIVFLTNFIQYAPEGFEVQAFRYLLKRDMNEKLIPYFEAASKEVVQRKRILTISVHSEPIDIPVSHILYLEANLRVIIVHLIHDERTEYHFYSNLSDLSKKLEDLGFLRVQRSFLVNMEYIVQLQYEKVSLTGGIVLPSSAKNHKELKQHYLLWRGKKRWAIS